MDREKVINGLTEIVNFFDIMSAIEGRCNELKQDAENAIDFLKEQEAVTVHDPGAYCPKCGWMLYPEDHPKFCGYCGRPLKWE